MAQISNVVIPTEGFKGSPERPFLAFWVEVERRDLVFQQRMYYVYMMMSSSRRALYTGITSRPRQRVWEHKAGAIDGFSERYHTTRLVYLEPHRYVATAIGREKQIKRWRREKKLALRESMNPQYRDLAADWFGPLAP